MPVLFFVFFQGDSTVYPKRGILDVLACRPMVPGCTVPYTEFIVRATVLEYLVLHVRVLCQYWRCFSAGQVLFFRLTWINCSLTFLL